MLFSFIYFLFFSLLLFCRCRDSSRSSSIRLVNVVFWFTFIYIHQYCSRLTMYTGSLTILLCQCGHVLCITLQIGYCQALLIVQRCHLSYATYTWVDAKGNFHLTTWVAQVGPFTRKSYQGTAVDLTVIHTVYLYCNSRCKGTWIINDNILPRLILFTGWNANSREKYIE